MNNSYPTVATIIGCPKELQSADGLVATPIVISGNNEEMQVSEPPVEELLPSDTTQIKDPVQKALVDNILGNLPTKATQEKFKCEMCNVEVSCRPAYLTHLSGNKHAKRVKEEELKNEVDNPHIKYVEDSKMYHCVLCNTVLNAKVQISAHLQGTKHKVKAGIKDSSPKKPRPPKQDNNTAENTNSMTSTGDKNGTKSPTPATGKQLFCSICKLHCNSDQQYQQHIASRKHLNKEKNRKTGGSWVRSGSRYGPYNRQNNDQSSRPPSLLNMEYMKYKSNYFRQESNNIYSRREMSRNQYDDEEEDWYGHQSYRNHPAYQLY